VLPQMHEHLEPRAPRARLARHLVMAELVGGRPPADDPANLVARLRIHDRSIAH
jgi:hypothetical protein